MNRFFRSVRYAINGIRTALQTGRNLRIQAGVALLVIGSGFYFEVTITEWCILLLSIALVTGLEMMNSALEHLVDLITKEHNPLAGKVKDIAAGSVLFAAFIAAVIGILVFAKYIF